MHEARIKNSTEVVITKAQSIAPVIFTHHTAEDPPIGAATERKTVYSSKVNLPDGTQSFRFTLNEPRNICFLIDGESISDKMTVTNDCLFDFNLVAPEVNGKIFEVIVQEDHGPAMISLENFLPDWGVEVAPYTWFIPAQGSDGGLEVSEVEAASDP